MLSGGKTHTERRNISTIFDLGSRWRWGVSFTALPIYTQGTIMEAINR
jgi:hypothetical protein